jgi:2-oxopent-4-enoate hydratase
VIGESEQAALADALAAAERSQVQIKPPSGTHQGLDVSDAYAVQRRNIDRRLAAGSRIVGHKVGLTSLAMQQMLGVDQPDFGHLLDDMTVEHGGSAPVARYCQPRIEPEVAFILARELRGPGVTVEDVVNATDYVAPALEIIDSRISDWQITLVDTIADNASSAGVVLGEQRTDPRDIDLTSVPVTMRVGDREEVSGDTSAVLGNPAAAVAWLANTLGGYGVALEAGHVVLPGSCTRALEVRPNDRVVAEFTGLGSVAVSFR